MGNDVINKPSKDQDDQDKDKDDRIDLEAEVEIRNESCLFAHLCNLYI